MPEYQFVLSGEKPAPAGRSARSHAMRTALQNRKENDKSREQGQIADSKLTENSKEKLKGRFRLASRPKKKKRGTLESTDLTVDKPHAEEVEGELVGALSAHVISSRKGRIEKLHDRVQRCDTLAPMNTALSFAGLDPFHTLPIPHNQWIDNMVSHFLTQFRVNYPSVVAQGVWFACALTHPLLMQTTLVVSGSGCLVTAPCPDPAFRHEVLYQKGQAINGVNDLIRRSETGDHLIGALGNLANAACFEGSFREADMHIRGLKHIIDLRGGFEEFIDKPLVLRLVSWPDLQTATSIGRKPLFPLVYDEEKAILPDSIPTDANLPSLEHIDAMGQGGVYVREAVTRCRQLFLVCKICPWWDAFELHLNITDHAIIHVLFDDNLKESLGGPLLPLMLTTHLFLYLFLRDMPTRGPVVRTMVDRLEEYLQPGRMEKCMWGDHLPALVWVLAVGAAAAEPKVAGEKHWMRTQLETVCRVTQMKSKEALKDMLRTFVWDDKICGEFLDGFWQAYSRQQALSSSTI